MPWLFLNMGGEMLYVLDQRLRAQQVAPAKAARVLSSIIGAMLDPALLAGHVFVPQDAWSLAGAKKIFERLAHSSIMRLSEARRAAAAGGATSPPSPTAEPCAPRRAAARPARAHKAMQPAYTRALQHGQAL